MIHFATYLGMGMSTNYMKQILPIQLQNIGTSVFHPLPSVGPQQLFALAELGCISEMGTS